MVEAEHHCGIWSVGKHSETSAQKEKDLLAVTNMMFGAKFNSFTINRVYMKALRY